LCSFTQVPSPRLKTGREVERYRGTEVQSAEVLQRCCRGYAEELVVQVAGAQQVQVHR